MGGYNWGFNGGFIWGLQLLVDDYNCWLMSIMGDLTTIFLGFHHE